MAWWDNLWLNEGFARWMQTKAADDLHPEWKTGLQALAVSESGKRADAKPSTHPIVQTVLTASQAEQAFDDITYDKGATVIGMLEAYVGAPAFREGVRRYMRAHAYGNTVDADFWREVQAAAGKPVQAVEADFTRQPGVPLLKVATEQTGGAERKILLSQGRFAEDPSTLAGAPVEIWRIPIALSAGGAATTHLLSGSAPVIRTVQGEGPVIANAGQSSYVRTLYSGAMIQALESQIAAIKPADQLGIFCDTWALGQSGYSPVTNYLDFAKAMPAAADPIVWLQIVSTLVSIETLYGEDTLYGDDSGHAAFIAFARSRLQLLAAKLGWDAQPNEQPNTATLRQAVLTALSRFGDQQVIAEAGRRFDFAQQHPGEISPAVRRSALSVVAQHADAETLDKLIGLLRATKDPLEKQNILEALESVIDPSGAQRVLELAVGPDTPAGLADSDLLAVSRQHPDLAWNFALQHVDQPSLPLNSSNRLTLMPEIASRSSTQKRTDDLQAYASEHIPSTARQNVMAAISTINLNAKFRTERLPEIDAWLSGKTTP